MRHPPRVTPRQAPPGAPRRLWRGAEQEDGKLAPDAGGAHHDQGTGDRARCSRTRGADQPKEFVMGDKGGKKDKHKAEKQKTQKQAEKDKRKKEKQTKSSQ